MHSLLRSAPALMTLALVAAGGAGGAWKPFLPTDAYEELQTRTKTDVLKKAYAHAAGKSETPPRLKAPDELGELMNSLRTKAKGGDGTAAELQYNGKLKNQNGIEPLIIALSAKKLSEENTAKTAKELELLGYRLAVLGAITHDNPSAKAEKNAKWGELSVQMRDASIALAAAAHKKDADGIQDASKRLEATCTQCHRDFR